MKTYARLTSEQKVNILEQKLLELEAEHFATNMNIELADEANIESDQLEQARGQLAMVELQLASVKGQIEALGGEAEKPKVVRKRAPSRNGN